MPLASAPNPAAAPATTAAADAVSGKEVFELAEEQLNAGRRLLQDGNTRIRRFVTERPAEAQVTLHEERRR